PTHHLPHSVFSLTAPAPPDTHTLSLHDALPISQSPHETYGLVGSLHTVKQVQLLADARKGFVAMGFRLRSQQHIEQSRLTPAKTDRKSTRLNSSHVAISYAVFCLKKKKQK